LQIRKNSTWTSNITYRLILLENRLLFIKMGGQITEPGRGTLAGLVLAIAVAVPCAQLHGIHRDQLKASGIVDELSQCWVENRAQSVNVCFAQYCEY
jgi:hypothetical protein